MASKSEGLRLALAKLSPQAATEFSRLFDAAMDRAYTEALWGAAYLIQGGCGDDSFADFRVSLISRGRDDYERAVAAPDALADQDFDENARFYEGYQYAVSKGVGQAVGASVARYAPHPAEPAGEAWEESTEFFKAAYPGLWSRFGAQ